MIEQTVGGGAPDRVRDHDKQTIILETKLENVETRNQACS